jgi:hypothetical protein
MSFGAGLLRKYSFFDDKDSARRKSNEQRFAEY